MTPERAIEEAAYAAADQVHALRFAVGDCGDSLVVPAAWSSPDAIRHATTAATSMIGDLSVVLSAVHDAAGRADESDLAARLAAAEALLREAWTRLQTPGQRS